MDEVRNQWEKARRYAGALIGVAARFRNDPEYGEAITTGNTILAVAAQTGDIHGAAKYLHDASIAPHISDWSLSASIAFYRTASILIDNKRTNDVVECLEALSENNDMNRDELLAAAAELRNGVMPEWYLRTAHI